eukprot:746927-Prorocentrum_lima.AAC.1
MTCSKANPPEEEPAAAPTPVGTIAAMATPVPGSAPVTPRMGAMHPVILPLDYSLDAALAAI